MNEPIHINKKGRKEGWVDYNNDEDDDDGKKKKEKRNKQINRTTTN